MGTLVDTQLRPTSIDVREPRVGHVVVMFVGLVFVVVDGTRMATEAEAHPCGIFRMVGSFGVMVTLCFVVVVVDVAWVMPTETFTLSVLVVTHAFLAETLCVNMLGHAVLISGMVAVTLALSSVGWFLVTLTCVLNSAAASVLTTCLHDVRRANFIGTLSRTERWLRLTRKSRGEGGQRGPEED
jgi:hypothetical protein